MDVSHISNIAKLKQKRRKKKKKKEMISRLFIYQKEEEKKTLEKENWGKTCSSPEEL